MKKTIIICSFILLICITVFFLYTGTMLEREIKSAKKIKIECIDKGVLYETHQEIDEVLSILNISDWEKLHKGIFDVQSDILPDFYITINDKIVLSFFEGWPQGSVSCAVCSSQNKFEYQRYEIDPMDFKYINDYVNLVLNVRS